MPRYFSLGLDLLGQPAYLIGLISQGLRMAVMMSLVTVTSLHAQVSESTRAAVAELQASDAAFRLKTFHRGCLDGSIVDPNCEEGVKGHMDTYLREKKVNAERAQVNAREAQVKAREAQLAIFDEIIFNLDISLAMMQLANYVEFNEAIPKDKDTVAMIINSDKAPAEVRAFLKNTMAKKEAGLIKDKSHLKGLTGFIKVYTDMAENSMGKITSRSKTFENLEKQIAVTRGTYLIFKKLADTAPK